MSHIICGIDLGSFSVKFVLLDVGFRHTTLRGLLETAVPGGDAPLLERQALAVRAGLAEVPGEAIPYFAVPGDQLSIRLLDLPFTDARKIDQVVGYELEGQIVHPLEDVVYDHLVARTTPEGSTVLAAAAKKEDVGALIAALEEQGAHPRSLYAAPVVYRRLVQAAPGASEPGTCEAVLDLGHLRTNLCIIQDGLTLHARTITRGGFHLTNAIALAFEADLERAEQAKRSESHLVSAASPAKTPIEAKLDTVLREALAPLIRDVRQTLASFRAMTKSVVGTLLLTGGTARLRGLPEFLESELGIPTRFLPVKPALTGRALVVEPGMDEVPMQAADSSPHALSAAIALAASSGSKEIDLRRGPFLYRASFSVLRQRALHLGILAGALVLAGGLDIFAAVSNLSDERRGLDKQLKTATSELFGQPRDDAAAVTQLLKKGFREELAPLPKATAFDLLDQISKKVPAGDKVKLDITELDIRPKKTFIKGTADSASAVDEIAVKLKEIDCYDDVSKGAITEVSGAKQFSLTVASKCP